MSPHIERKIAQRQSRGECIACGKVTCQCKSSEKLGILLRVPDYLLTEVEKRAGTTVRETKREIANRHHRMFPRVSGADIVKQAVNKLRERNPKITLKAIRAELRGMGLIAVAGLLVRRQDGTDVGEPTQEAGAAIPANCIT